MDALAAGELDILRAVELAEVEPAPFEHLRIHQPFSATLYDEALRRLPPTSVYHELRHRDAILPNGRSSRMKLELGSIDQLRGLKTADREFWQRIHAAFADESLADTLFRKFSSTLTRRFPEGMPPVIADVMLLRDFPGYHISVHPDVPRKLLTLQIYLPRNDARPHLGTRFYQKVRRQFVEATMIPFYRNSGYAFAVVPRAGFGCRKSWHAVEPLAATDEPRDSLMVVYKKKIADDASYD